MKKSNEVDSFKSDDEDEELRLLNQSIDFKYLEKKYDS